MLVVWHANTASRPSYMHCNIRFTNTASRPSYTHCNIRLTNTASRPSYTHCNIRLHRHLQHSVFLSLIHMSASRGPGFQPRPRHGLTWDDLCSFSRTDATVLSQIKPCAMLWALALLWATDSACQYRYCTSHLQKCRFTFEHSSTAQPDEDRSLVCCGAMLVANLFVLDIMLLRQTCNILAVNTASYARRCVSFINAALHSADALKFGVASVCDAAVWMFFSFPFPHPVLNVNFSSPFPFYNCWSSDLGR